MWKNRTRVWVGASLVVAASTSCWLAWAVRSARIQREAVKAIVAQGGEVQYIWRYYGEGGPRVPRWVVDLLGVDFFGHVARVEARRTGSDETMAQIGRLSQVEDVLVGPNVSDLGLAHLKGQTNLRNLYLEGAGITDAGLDHLVGMSRLGGVSFERSQVTSVGMDRLEERLPRLRFRSTWNRHGLRSTKAQGSP